MVRFGQILQNSTCTEEQLTKIYWNVCEVKMKDREIHKEAVVKASQNIVKEEICFFMFMDSRL